MSTRSFIWGAAIISCLASIGHGQQLPEDRPANPAKVQAPVDREMIDTVKSIRQRLGGGVAERLKDSSLNPDTIRQAEQEFERELSRLASGHLTQPHAKPSSNGAGNSPSSLHNRENPIGVDPPSGLGRVSDPGKLGNVRNRVNPTEFNRIPANGTSYLPAHSPAFSNGYRGINYGVPVPAQPAVAVQHPSPADVLRQAAQQLDGIAAVMEANQLYDEADEIRDRARKFWLKARSLKNNSN